MPDFAKRSYEKELLDKDDIPFDDIRLNMKELNTINSLLGGHDISIQGLKKLTGSNQKGKQLHICEIGCGGGDNLKAIADWCKKNNINCRFTGIDIKDTCTAFADQQYPGLAKWITADYSDVSFTEGKPDIIFSSLFCHHFTEMELTDMLGWMRKNSTLGFFINDLQRNPLAWFLIKWLTRFFSKSYLVKNDAPLSVRRGFTKNEIKAIFETAGISNYSIQWKWAFRFLIISRNDS